GAGIDELAVFAGVFHAGAHAAPETKLRRRIDAVMGRPDGGEVNITRRGRVDRGEDMIVERPFIVVGVDRPGLAEKKLFSEAEHIVGVAGLRPLAMFQHAVEIGWCVEVLGNTVAAKNNRSAAGNRIPEKTRAGIGSSVAGKRGDALETGDLRDLRVGVQTGEAVLLVHERAKNGLMAKPARKLEILLIAGDCIEVRQDFIHAAVLGVEHLLHLLVRETSNDAVTPIPQPEQYLAGLLIARDQPGVTKSGKSLVEIIPRHPFTSEGFDAAAGHLCPEGAAARDTADVPVAGSLLAALQFGNHVIESATQFTRRRIRSGGA